MNRIAIDFAGTLDRWPDQLGALIRSLHRDGWEVILLAGEIGQRNDIFTDGSHYGGRLAFCLQHDIPVSDIVVCVGITHEDVRRQKYLWLARHPTILYVDDDPLYTQEARHASPSTCVLRVEP